MEKILNLDFDLNSLKQTSLSMFNKGFFGLSYGSISQKIDANKFIINKNNAMLDRLDESYLVLLFTKKDYRWNEASIDSDIHLNIYNNIPEAKFMICSMPTYTIAHSINNEYLVPKDYLGSINFPKIKIYDPKNFDDWLERAPSEIFRYMLENHQNLIIIRGYGVVSYDRTLHSLVKNISIIENSCKILFFEKNN